MMIKKKILLWMIVLLFPFVLTSCHERDASTDTLLYSVWSDHVAITGLTEEGEKQETIVIPAEIDGLHVDQIGDIIMSGRKYGIMSDSLKTLIVLSDSVTFDGFGAGGYNLETIVFSSYQPILHDGLSIKNLSIYVPAKQVDAYKTVYEEYYTVYSSEITHADDYHYDILPANVSFMNHYSDEINGGYVQVMQVKPNQLIEEPEIPFREGYQFTGWFYDSEGTIPWDFQNDLKLDSTETILYANWDELD